MLCTAVICARLAGTLGQELSASDAAGWRHCGHWSWCWSTVSKMASLCAALAAAEANFSCLVCLEPLVYAGGYSDTSVWVCDCISRSGHWLREAWLCGSGEKQVSGQASPTPGTESQCWTSTPQPACLNGSVNKQSVHKSRFSYLDCVWSALSLSTEFCIDGVSLCEIETVVTIHLSCMYIRACR